MGKDISGHTLRYSIILVASICVLGYVVYSYAKDYYHSRQVYAEFLALKQEANRLQTRNVQLADLLRYFDSESYAESRARLELGLVKPGEKVVVVPSEGIDGNGPIEADLVQGKAPASPLRAWWAYFFHHHGLPDT